MEKEVTKLPFSPPWPQISTKFDEIFTTDFQMIVLYSNDIILIKIELTTDDVIAN